LIGGGRRGFIPGGRKKGSLEDDERGVEVDEDEELENEVGEESKSGLNLFSSSDSPCR
jgi:hypothetical protein